MPEMPVRLLVLTRIIAPYRIPVFNELADRPEIELRVVYLAETESDRSWAVYRDEIRHDYVVLPELGQPVVREHHVHLSHGVHRELGRFRPDVVIAGGWDQPAYLACAALKNRFGYRFGCFVESTSRDHRPFSRLGTAVRKWLIRISDGFVVPGTASARYLMSLGVPRSRLSVAPNSVDNSLYECPPDRRTSEPGCVRFLYVGRLVPQKGIRVLLEAWTRFEGPSYRLTLVGEGPMLPWIDHWRSAHPSASEVLTAGHGDRNAVAASYRTADVFVYPPLSDPWGLVINEAMAAGLPVVTSDAPGSVPDLVVDGDNGAIVPAGDARSFAHAMRRLASEPGLRRTMGGRSSDRIRAFTPSRAAEGFAAAALGMAMPGQVLR